MKIMSALLLLTISFFLINANFVSAAEKVCVYFFYGEGCPSCARVYPLIDQLEQKYPLEVHRFEIYNNRSNLLLLNEYFDKYHIPEAERAIPAIFISDDYLIDDEPILNNLEEKIKSLPEGSECPSLENITEKTSLEKLGSLSLVVVTGAALVDSINPCAIAVLLILLGALLATGEKTKALKAGAAFIISIYIVYFLFGLGLFSALQISGLSYYFYKFIGILAIIIGLFNMKDFFWYGGGGFVMEIPRSWRPTLKKLLSNVTNPGVAFLMGFAVSLFELPCTGGPYIFILGLLAEKTTQLLAVPILLYYNLIFILPLIVITILLYFGYSSVEKATKWKDRNIKILHLIAGLIMLALGILVVSGSV